MIAFLLVLYASSSFATSNLFQNPRILNGENATQGQFPYQVGILNIKENLEMHFCGGAIISEEWILTSAHCIDEAKEIGVYSGTVDIADINRVVTTSEIYTVHPEYDPVTLANDIGVIFLEPPLVFDDNTQAISLSDTELESGVNATVTGWGSPRDGNGILNPNLQYAVVATLENSNCKKIYGDVVSEKVVCAIGDDPPKNPCFNDGGAPLVFGGVHVAVFSFLGIGGCEDYTHPAGYTRTASYRDWIREETGV